MRLRFLLVACLFFFAAGINANPGGSELTPNQIKAVYTAFEKARTDGFTIDSMVAIYKLENSATAIKKLVDAAQSNPNMSISQTDSFAMEATRDKMNQMVLDHLAEVTGGTVEVINFGKQNGIRSDKDQTVYAVDGKRVYDASEIKEAYERKFKETFEIDIARMDMSLFDGDASIPDWRKVDMSFDEYVNKYQKGQAKLEQNSEAYQEAGTYRAQVESRTANQGRVRITRTNPKTGKLEVINGTAKEISERHSKWIADVPYRNAMDSSVENKGRFDHSSDFVDKMKYFNRTIGNGLNALALDKWDVNYIFHLDSLKSPAERTAFIKQMVADTYVIDASAGQQQQFVKVIDIAANIELDKMNDATKSEAHYLQPLIQLEQENARSRKESLSDTELLSRARTTFHNMQSHIMDRNIVLTTRQKISHDFDPNHLKKIANKYGVEQAKKLRWETARQITRAFEIIKDPKMIDRLVGNAPDHLRLDLEAMRLTAIIDARAKRSRTRPPIKIKSSSAAAALTTGPEEVVLAKATDSFMEKRRQESEQLVNKLKSKYEDFDAALRSGKYSDEAVSKKIRNRVLDSLGFEERKSFDQMETEYQRKFSGSKLLSNVVDLGNVSSLLSCIQVYQQTGDLTKVAQTAVWELVSNIPGVSQVTTLNQSFNDGNYESLAWLFISWKLPAAGQVKMVFDIASNSMKIVYSHAMVPLENDRFSQVYKGYIDKQAAGWSPLTPGWKERQNAASLSILEFVPGITFDEKRSNMYAFFEAKLQKKFARKNMDPTKAGYYQMRDGILDEYFGTYVQDYFNNRGEFSKNTAGYHHIASLPKLKLRLINTLVNDFKLGEVNDEKAQDALDEMNDAIDKIKKQTSESIKIERTLLQSQDFINQKMQQKLSGVFDQVEKEERKTPKKTVARVKVEVYPKVVLENQKSRIVVKALSSNNDKGGEAHKIEIKALKPLSVVSGAENIAEKLGEVIDTIDAPLVAKLNKPDVSSDAELFVTKLRYEVSVKDTSGLLLSKEEVSVNLAATESSAVVKSSGNTKIMIKIYPVRLKSGEPVPIKWEAPSPQNSKSVPGRKTRYDPYVWLRWENMPNDKHYAACITAKGALPYFEKDYCNTFTPFKEFAWDNKSDSHEKGNAFTMQIPDKPGRRVGKIEVSGELFAFDEYVSSSKARTTKSVASLPFETSFTRFDMPYEMQATAKLNNKGFVTGEIKSKYRQTGKRISKVSAGSSTFYAFFDGRLKFSLPNTHSVPSNISLTFKDYGKMVTVDVPIKETRSSSRKKEKPVDVDELLKIVEDLKSKKDRYRHMAYIASFYSDIAWHFGKKRDWGNYLKYRDLEIEWRTKIISQAKNANWKGWDTYSMYINYNYHPIKNIKDPAKKKAKHAAIINELYRDLVKLNKLVATTLMQNYRADEVGKYLEAAKNNIANIVSNNSSGHSYRSLVSDYNRYADVVFHTTGDLNAATAIHQVGQEIQRIAMQLIGKPFKEQTYHFKLDAKFENSHLSGKKP